MKPLLRLLLASLTLPTLVACGASDAPSGSDAETTSYTTRGIVRAMPNPEQPGSELQIRHEEIPDFKSIDGEVVGMKSMTMPFPVDPSMLEGLAVGDRVAFDFEVSWTGSPPMKVTRLEALSPDTVLGFEEPQEPQEAGPGDPEEQEPVLEAPVESPD